MPKASSKNKTERQGLAVALCFAATTLLSLQALHPEACAWMGLDSEQSYTLDALFAAVCAFFGGLILSQLAAARSSDK
jgi:hypothetical protein